MKKFVLQFIAAVALVVGGFLLLGFVGNMDLCDQTIINMSQEEYDSIKNHLTKVTGDTPSDRDIANWWIDNHKE